jgi:hypothetical protein
VEGVVVVAGRTDVGGAIVEVGAVVVTAGTVVVGSAKTTSGLVTVVTGAGAVVGATVGVVARVGVVTVVVAAGGVVVVLLAVVGVPGALRPSITTVDANPEIGGCIGGRITVGTAIVGDVSRDTAATSMTRTSVPTPAARRAFVRDARSSSCHQLRIRSSAGGRPNAAFLPMDDHAG